MFLKLLFFFIFFILPLFLLITNALVSLKAGKSRSLSSSFECGFDPFENARTSFSLHFFMIAMIFLVFDLEIVFLLPFPWYLSTTPSSVFFQLFLFLGILFVGTVHEWNEGSLKWF